MNQSNFKLVVYMTELQKNMFECNIIYLFIWHNYNII